MLIDGRPIIGEDVIVFGQGIVGLLTTSLLDIMPLSSTITSDKATKNSVKSLTGSTDGIVASPGKDHINPKATEFTKPERPLKLLFVGNLQPHKGLDVLACSLRNFREFRLKVAGDKRQNPSYTEKIEELIDYWDMESNIEFPGVLSRRGLSKAFRESDLLIVPSFYEGFGIAYVEALGYGVPVIATSNGGAGEIIRDGREGFLLNPSDAEQLTKYLRWFKQNPKYIERMSFMARKKYKELPTWEKSMKKVIEYLRSKSRN